MVEGKRWTVLNWPAVSQDLIQLKTFFREHNLPLQWPDANLKEHEQKKQWKKIQAERFRELLHATFRGCHC